MRPRALSFLPIVVTAFAACGTSSTTGLTTGASSAGSTSGATTGTGGAPTTTGPGASSTATTATTATTSTSSTAGTGGSSTTSTGTGTGGVPIGDARPPGHPAMSDTFGAGSVTFAISKLYLGNTDRDGTPDQANGWKQYGFDIDGKISTAASTDLCKPRNNASPQNVYPDGNGGIDNAFGKNILPILLGLSSTFPQKENNAIASGKTTLLIDLLKLGTGADYDPLSGRLYPVTDLGHVPLFDGSDAWPVDPAGLAVGGDLTSAKVQFPLGYVNGDTWVGPTQNSVTLVLYASIDVPLVIQHAVLAMTLDPTHTHATNGTISGVLDTATLVAAIKQGAGHFDPSLCSGPTIDSLLVQITQASDILHDGTQDPTQLCDGISIGLGFDAELVKLGPIGPVIPPPPSPCP